MKKILPDYITPTDFHCPVCKESCKIIALDNATDVAATHCTHGLPETWYPDSWGDPVCDQCHAFVDDYEYSGDDYD